MEQKSTNVCVCVCEGVVKGHRAEGSELFYSIERDGQRHWHNRTAVILSLDQGNRLREQHSLGPYETSTPLTKASDISLGKTSPTQVWLLSLLISGNFCLWLAVLPSGMPHP